MSTIFEIVRLAQERYASNDHAKANRSYTDAEGNLLPTLAGAYTYTPGPGLTPLRFPAALLTRRAPGFSLSVTGATCSLPEDCTSTCEQECVALGAVQRCDGFCRPKCDETCAAATNDDDPCRVQCMSGCHDTCRGVQQTAMLRQRDECISAARDRRCHDECEGVDGDTADSRCYRGCVERETDLCRAALHPPCFARCGRHVCAQGLCKCPIYSSGAPLVCPRPLHGAPAVRQPVSGQGICRTQGGWSVTQACSANLCVFGFTVLETAVRTAREEDHSHSLHMSWYSASSR